MKQIFHIYVNIGMKLNTEIYKLNQIFQSNNKRLYVVGGAVRDYLMGIKPNDYDLVSDATPNEIINMLTTKKYKCDLQGEHFGVVRVFTDDNSEGYEIATFRTDVSNGRDNKSESKKVDYGKNITINDDVVRRDFTINALYFDIENNLIIDLVNGIKDINNKTLKTVGDPKLRFEEDRLRILRVFRFASIYDLKIDESIIDALNIDNRLFNVSKSDDVSKERVVGEFLKMETKGKDNFILLKKYFKYILDYNILQQLLPNSNLVCDLKSTSKLSVMLALILIENDINENLITELKNAKFSNKLIDKILGLLYFKNGIDINDYYKFKKEYIKRKLGFDELTIWFHLRGLNLYILKPFIMFENNIKGEDVMKDGFIGEEIGYEIEKRENERFIRYCEYVHLLD